MALDMVGNRTLRDLLDERVERNGDKAFIVYENRDGEVSELSYALEPAGAAR